MTLAQDPTQAAQRNADIDSGAGRCAEVLRDDVVGSGRALDDCCQGGTAAGWPHAHLRATLLAWLAGRAELASPAILPPWG